MGLTVNSRVLFAALDEVKRSYNNLQKNLYILPLKDELQEVNNTKLNIKIHLNKLEKEETALTSNQTLMGKLYRDEVRKIGVQLEGVKKAQETLMRLNSYKMVNPGLYQFRVNLMTGDLEISNDQHWNGLTPVQKMEAISDYKDRKKQELEKEMGEYEKNLQNLDEKIGKDKLDEKIGKYKIASAKTLLKTEQKHLETQRKTLQKALSDKRWTTFKTHLGVRIGARLLLSPITVPALLVGVIGRGCGIVVRHGLGLLGGGLGAVVGIVIAAITRSKEKIGTAAKMGYKIGNAPGAILNATARMVQDGAIHALMGSSKAFLTTLKHGWDKGWKSELWSKLLGKTGGAVISAPKGEEFQYPSPHKIV